MSKILIVDDEPDLLELLSGALQQAGHSVLTASNGTDALRLAHRELPKLIILDLLLPDLDGFTVCESLRRQPDTSHLPILMLTGVSGEIPRCAGAEAGVDQYLTKPVRVQEVLKRVNQLLESRG
jgi:DNA-binding response OmpR family regulator